MEEKTPETQDTSTGDGLIFGKFKTLEEAEAAHKEMERKQTELRESLDREQRLNSLLATEQKITEPAREEPPAHYVPLTQSFDEEQVKTLNQWISQREHAITEKAQRLIYNTLSEVENRRRAEDKFYTLYPELRTFDREVDDEALRLRSELGDKIQRVNFESLAKEVAKRVKDRLADQKRKLTKTALHLETGTVQTPEVAVKESEPEKTSEEDRAKAYFEKEVWKKSSSERK